ncbi:MAG: CBS domain-containing protein [Candidatus Heimdallarchaeota archaeon]|nr:CBS domain-containing protein [Candidatus Heimdallarchaeota archaeon]
MDFVINMSKNIPVSKIMTKREEVVTMDIPGNRDQLLEAIQETGLSVYPVVKKGTNELAGIVSRSDLFKNPDETQLSLLMIRDVVTLKETDTVIAASKIFIRHVFQRIPIVDEDGITLKGIVSRDDIVKKVVVPAKIDIEIDYYFDKNVATIWEGTPLPVAAKILRLCHQKGLPVLNETEMVGIITQNDFLKVAEIWDSMSKSLTGHGAENDSSSWDSESILIIGAKTLTLPRNLKVSDIMETNIEVCYSYSTIEDISRKMVQKKIDQLPVVSPDGSILGIINQKHVISAYIDFIEGKVIE